MEDRDLTERFQDSFKNKFVSELISLNSDFVSMPFYRFAELIKNPKVRAEVIRGLKYDPTATADELDHWLALAEKD